jgi:hypothetical protein
MISRARFASRIAGWEGHFPAAIVGGGICGCLVSAELHRDRGTRRGPTPDGDRLATLEEHVAVQDGMEPELFRWVLFLM